MACINYFNIGTNFA